MPRRKSIPPPVRKMRPQPTQRPPAARVQVTLTTRHNINGTLYGPGIVTVRGDIADVLREQEQRVKDSDRMLFEPRSAIIGPSGRLVKVPQGYFDDGGLLRNTTFHV